jgi:mRNA interferase MazF
VLQGEIWLLETPNDKRRPVLVVSRNESIPVRNKVVVAPITSTIRSIRSCIPVAAENGVEHDSVASFDNIATVPKSALATRLGALGHDGRQLICGALEAVADC